MTADIPEWDPATFKPTHKTKYYLKEVMATHRFRIAVRPAIGYIDEGGVPSFDFAADLTPIPEPVTAREQWGTITSRGGFVATATEADARAIICESTTRHLAQLKAIDGRLVLCDGDGNPVRVTS